MTTHHVVYVSTPFVGIPIFHHNILVCHKRMPLNHTHTEVGSNNSREGKNQLIEQFLCVNPMFEPSFAEKNANLSPGGSKSGSPGHSKGKGPPQGAAKSPDHARGVSGISETWEYGSTGAPSPCNGQRSSTPSTKVSVCFYV